MIKRLVVVVLVALSSLASTAFAQDTSAALQNARAAVISTGLDVAKERMLVGSRGTEDLWLYTRESYDTAVKRMRTAFDKQTVLPGGIRIVGHARLISNGTFNFTLRNESGETMLLQIREDGKRAIARIEGRVRQDIRGTEARPATPKPHLVKVDYTP
jgi:hypothetical protein